MVIIENRTRREPAINAIQVASEFGNRYPIVTLEPLVVQTYGTRATKVISLPFLTSERVRASDGVVYLRQDHYQSDVDQRRYANGFAALPTESPIELRRGSGWAVLALGTTIQRESPRKRD